MVVVDDRLEHRRIAVRQDRERNVEISEHAQRARRIVEDVETVVLAHQRDGLFIPQRET